MAMSQVGSEYQFPKQLTIPVLKRLDAPGKLVFLAVQTQKVQMTRTQYKRVLVRGHAVYWRRESKSKGEVIEPFQFSNSLDFFEWLCGRINKRETLYLYAHDITTDFLSLDGFRQLPLQDFTLQSIYHKLTTTIMRFANDNRRLTILDIQNYYAVKLESLAQSFKAEIVQEPNDVLDQDAGFTWCASKARLIQAVMVQLINEVVQAKKGSLKMTASGTAFSMYRASYMRHKIVTSHDPVLVAFERSSYVGGYTAVNHLAQAGDPELYKLDVNSMYPSVMYNQRFPTRLVDFAANVSVKQLERFINGNLVIGHVSLQAKSANFPYKQGAGNYYPVGPFETTLATASLSSALQNDEITKVHKVAIYHAEPIFAEFIVDTYNARMKAKSEGNTAHELLQKAISNTLYGKFGQLQTETVRVGDAPLDEFCVMDAFDPASNTAWLEMHAGGSILFIKRKDETRYTSFAIASHITDYARCKLFALMEKAGRQNVLYTDTDSLIVTRDGFRNLYPVVHQARIGWVKLEGSAPFFIGFAKKDYIFGETRRLKGFDLQGQRAEENVFTQYQRTSVTGAMNKRLSDGAWWSQVNKIYSPFVQGVKIMDDGAIRPLHMQTESDQLHLRKHTFARVREIVAHTFTDQQKAYVGEWLRL